MGWNERVDYLIHVHLPWYFNFVLSWREAARHIEICAVTYEQFFSDQTRELNRIAAFYGIRVSESQVSAAIGRAARSDTRFNVGVSGRGAEMLNCSHTQAVRRLANVCRIELDESGSIFALLPAQALCSIAACGLFRWLPEPTARRAACGRPRELRARGGHRRQACYQAALAGATEG